MYKRWFYEWLFRIVLFMCFLRFRSLAYALTLYSSVAYSDGYTPMHGAGFQGRAEIMKLLIEHGLDPLDAHKDGYTPIHRAAWGKEERHTETIRVLIDVGNVPHDFKAPGSGKTALEMTKNPSSIALLEERAALALADKEDGGGGDDDGSNSEL